MKEPEKSGTEVSSIRRGPKGGTLFPKISLQKAVEYSKKLVAKTHTGSQPEQTVLAGVFGNVGNDGKIRASALKQFGLLEGTNKALKATQLGKDIDAAMEEELPRLLQRSFLCSKLFNQLFEVFHGDTVTRGKIEQRAKGLDVHPESAAECARLFIESALTASIGTPASDGILLIKSGEVAQEVSPATPDDEEQGLEEIGKGDQEEPKTTGSSDKTNGSPERDTHEGLGKPGVHLNLTVDPSSDPDKLEKQLKLLRQYGVI